MDDANRSLYAVQFTDTHFFASSDLTLMGVDTAATFEQVRHLAHLKRSAPDFYLLTGDLSQDETPESYGRFASAVSSLDAPTYYLPGNHDVGARMQVAFAEKGAPFRTDNQFVKGQWQIILLDTHVEGQVAGSLSSSELKRLDDLLAAEAGKHALVVLHHHPVPSGSAWLDTIGVSNAGEFLSVIDRHAAVRGVLFGHIHQEFEHLRNGVKYMGTPSTCVQFKPRTDEFAVDPMPPGFRWLELHADGTLTSEVLRVASVAAGLDMASAGY